MLSHSRPRPAAFRGLCPAHYQAAKRQIQAGNTSWAELEGKGIARPKKVSPFMAALAGGGAEKGLGSGDLPFIPNP